MNKDYYVAKKKKVTFSDGRFFFLYVTDRRVGNYGIERRTHIEYLEQELSLIQEIKPKNLKV